MQESKPGHELKTHTRRDGWSKIKIGERLTAVEKCQGLKLGEHVKPIRIIEVYEVNREPLMDIVRRPYRDGKYEVEREGFPEWIDQEIKFVEMYQKSSHLHRKDPEKPVARIGFKHLWDVPAVFKWVSPYKNKQNTLTEAY